LTSAREAADSSRAAAKEGESMEHTDDSLWSAGLAVVRKLEEAGYRAYLVGGCVRDRRLGRPLNDIDIAASAKPEEVIALFARTLPTGLRHGTVTVVEHGIPFEVTTFRQEEGYSDGRRPDGVAFVEDVREDLARRDFTFNAMAVGLDGELVDPFGGEDALRAGVVDCVGEPSERFGEDALRMMRAIRFAAELGFEILPEVWDGLIANREKLRFVAIERIAAEWDKMMAGSGPEQAMHYLFKSGLLAYAKEPLPDAFLGAAERYRLNGGEWQWDPWGASSDDEASSGNLLYLPFLPEADLRWAALLIGMKLSGEDARELMQTLRIGGKRASRVAAVVDLARRKDDGAGDRISWISAVLSGGKPAALDALDVLEACGADVGREREWLEEMPVSETAELNVKGDELAAYLGRAPGPWVAEALRGLLAETAAGALPNEKFALLAAAKAMKPETMGERE